jgi:hypothetical protein
LPGVVRLDGPRGDLFAVPVCAGLAGGCAFGAFEQAIRALTRVRGALT